MDNFDVIAQQNYDRNLLKQNDPNFYTDGLGAKAEDIENAETVTLIEKYLEYNKVSILYGESGSGKSLLTLSVCVYLIENTMIDKIVYYDFDNGKGDQKIRGIHKLIRHFEGSFVYVNLDSLDDADITPPKVLQGLIDNQLNGKTPYEKTFMIFDTMGELVEGSLGKDEIMRPLLDKLKKLRSMGATVQAIHHTTKSKEDITFFGSNYIKIKIDALWHLTSKDIAKEDAMEFALKNVKNRSGNLSDCAFIINPIKHTLDDADFTIASIGDEEAAFIASVRTILGTDDYVVMSQTDLLEELEKSNKDKKAIEWLKKHSGKFWKRVESNSFPKTVKYETL